MRRKNLRNLLIMSAFSLPILSSLTWWMLGYGPWIGTTLDTYNLGPVIILMTLQGFFNAVPVSAVSLWAAHNLKPLSWLSTAALSRFCLLGIVACVICVILSGFETYAEAAAYGEALHFGLGELAYSFQFVIYGIAMAVILLFSRFQLKQHLAGEKIQEATFADTFS